MAYISAFDSLSIRSPTIADFPDEILYLILFNVRLPLQDGQFIDILTVCRRWLPIARGVLYHSLNLFDNRIIDFQRDFLSTEAGVILNSSEEASPLRIARNLKIVVGTTSSEATNVALAASSLDGMTAYHPVDVTIAIDAIICSMASILTSLDIYLPFDSDPEPIPLLFSLKSLRIQFHDLTESLYRHRQQDLKKSVERSMELTTFVPSLPHMTCLKRLEVSGMRFVEPFESKGFDFELIQLSLDFVLVESPVLIHLLAFCASLKEVHFGKIFYSDVLDATENTMIFEMLSLETKVHLSEPISANWLFHTQRVIATRLVQDVVENQQFLVMDLFNSKTLRYLTLENVNLRLLKNISHPTMCLTGLTVRRCSGLYSSTVCKLFLSSIDTLLFIATDYTSLHSSRNGPLPILFDSPKLIALSFRMQEVDPPAGSSKRPKHVNLAKFFREFLCFCTLRLFELDWDVTLVKYGTIFPLPEMPQLKYLRILFCEASLTDKFLLSQAIAQAENLSRLEIIQVNDFKWRVSNAAKLSKRSKGVPLTKVLGTKKMTDWERADLSKGWIEEFASLNTGASWNGENIRYDGLGEYWWRVLGV
jgi:hypothetical protein